MIVPTAASPLAILGGRPAFSAPLHVGRPNIGNRVALQRRFDAMLDRNWLTNDGPLVKEFEQRIAEYVGVKHCVVMCNATVALEIAIRGAGLTGEVIVPSFTFVATAHALQWQEITPVFCDIDPRTHNIDPGRVEHMITPRTTGIIGVHLWGRPGPIEELEEIARRRNLTLMFDAAHAFGCTQRGRMIGCFGLCEVFSFHATKFLNSFEGGAVVTDDEEFAAKLRLMRNFGFADYDKVIYIGTNGKMTEPAAAMGLTSLESIDQFIAINRRNHEAYVKELADLPGITLLRYNTAESNNFQYVVVEVDSDRYGLNRDELVAVLHAENVLARRYFYPGCHGMEPYRSYFPHAGLLLPETERLCRRVLLLPTGTSVDGTSIATIASIIRTAAARAPEVHEAVRLRGSAATNLQLQREMQSEPA
jgi:dTDP-4-amino-4,6-dideoxygalactose transaminase